MPTKKSLQEVEQAVESIGGKVICREKRYPEKVGKKGARYHVLYWCHRKHLNFCSQDNLLESINQQTSSQGCSLCKNSRNESHTFAGVITIRLLVRIIRVLSENNNILSRKRDEIVNILSEILRTRPPQRVKNEINVPDYIPVLLEDYNFNYLMTDEEEESSNTGEEIETPIQEETAVEEETSSEEDAFIEEDDDRGLSTDPNLQAELDHEDVDEISTQNLQANWNHEFRMKELEVKLITERTKQMQIELDLYRLKNEGLRIF
jgi:hypothetical protein